MILQKFRSERNHEMPQALVSEPQTDAKYDGSEMMKVKAEISRQLNDTLKHMESVEPRLFAKVMELTGSTYTRWGRKDCSPGSKLIYPGLHRTYFSLWYITATDKCLAVKQSCLDRRISVALL